MDEALQTLNVVPNVLSKRSNTMWDILLATEDKAKRLAGNIGRLTTKSVRLQSECMDTRKTRITLYGVPVVISDDHVGAFFPIWIGCRYLTDEAQNGNIGRKCCCTCHITEEER